MQDDATGKILAAQFFPTETAEGYFRLLQRLLRRFGVPTAFYGDRGGIFVRNDPHWSLEEELAGQRQPASASPAQKSSSIKLSMAGSRSTTVILASNTPTPQGGDIFMLPLG
jgi:hypothetical protein